MRFEHALRQSVRELENLRERVLSELGETEAGIVEAHLAFLHDPEFVKRVKSRVTRDLVNVEDAVNIEIADVENLLQEIESEYIRERSQDVRDIGQRILKHLAAPIGGRSHGLARLPPRSVLIAKELLPSHTIELDRKSVVGIVTERGGTSSHAAILARSLGIPLVTKIPQIATILSGGEWILLDGNAGTVTVAPSERNFARFSKAKQGYDAVSRETVKREIQPCATRDGAKVDLYANIARVEDVGLIEKHHLKGVGLFRTEYLFLESRRPPDLRRQFQTYRIVAEKLGNLPLIIRTLDLGGDKKPAFLACEFEANPNMGFRGLRYSLLEKNMFTTQLRAMLRANTRGNIRILFPMVLGVADLQQAIELLRRAAAKEKAGSLPPVGAMIETPAAVFEIDGIFKLADFVSIGTNDLTQFMLAADRNSAGMLDHCSVLHPGVIKAISRVVAAAKARSRGVSVCGEAAGSPAIAGLLVGLGVRQLSLSPVRAARVSQFIRSNSLKDLQKAAQRALKSDDEKEIQDILSCLRNEAAA